MTQNDHDHHSTSEQAAVSNIATTEKILSKCIKCGAELPEGAVFCHICGKKQAPEPRKHRKRANGTGNISKLSGNRKKPWMARRGGIMIGTFATRTEAQKALERLTDADVNERFNLTFKQIHDLWLPEHERTISEHGKGSYKSALGNCEELHDQVFRKLRTSDFQAVIIRLEKKGLSKSTCEKVLQLFGQLSAWAIREGIQQVNYAKFCTIAAEQKSEGKVLPSAAIKALQKSKAEAAKISLVLLATGCRGNELFNVPTDNCSDRYFIGGSKTEAGKSRVVVVAPIGLGAYRELLAKARAEGKPRLIDAYAGNKTYNNYAKREFKALMKELGLEGYTPYDLRHTFATQATRDGMDPQILKRQMGHQDISTTDKYYTHLDLNDLLQAIGTLDITKTVCNKSATNQKALKFTKRKSS